MEQTCSRCQLVLPVESFSPSYRGKRGTWCRACFSAYNRGERGPSKQAKPRVCVECGRTYTPAAVKANAVGFCSRECKTAVRNRRLATDRLESKPTDRVCLNCGAALGQERRADVRYCGDSCMWQARNKRMTPAQRRANKLKENFGMTPEGFDAMLAAQGSACKICRTETPTDSRGFTPWHVDHDHNTGSVRGVLCGPCNLGLGLFKDSPTAMRSAAAYLRAARGV